MESNQTLPNLVKLYKGASDVNLFCLHPGGGGGVASIYKSLIKRLGGSYSVFGFNALDLEGRSLPAESVEKIASRYISQMQAVQPTGPYQMVGWSAGGLIAFEMANQLLARGETTSLLALLDTQSMKEDGESTSDGWLQFLTFIEYIGLSNEAKSLQNVPKWAEMNKEEKLRLISDKIRSKEGIGKMLSTDELLYLHTVFTSLSGSVNNSVFYSK